MKRARTALAMVSFIMMTFVSWAGGQELSDISLPAPRQEGGKPLMQVLKERQSSRAFSAERLPDQMVSDLLWAAAGVNRPDSGKRTAPSARNWQEIEVYVVMEEGAYVYDGKSHTLKGVVKGDLRGLTGSQEFAATAPFDLVYVADVTKMTGSSPEDHALYTGVDTGFIGQNVYLFCASEGLVTVFRGSVDRKALAEALKLPDHKRVTFAQTVGYPAPSKE
jgi:SagB-type dehydrogenase family enzyme